MHNNIGAARRAYARAAGGFTQDDAADYFGVSLSTYRKWEQGQTVVNGEQLREVADKYGVTTDYLLLRGSGAGLSDTAVGTDAAGAELLRRFSRLSPAGRRRLLEDAAILEDSGRYALAS